MITTTLREDLQNEIANKPSLPQTIARICGLIEQEQHTKAIADVKSLEISKEREYQRHRTYSDVVALLEGLIPDERKDYFDAARRGNTET